MIQNMMKCNFKSQLSSSSSKHSSVRSQEGEESSIENPTTQAMHFCVNENSLGMQRVKSNRSSDYFQMLGVNKDQSFSRNIHRSDEQYQEIVKLTKRSSLENSIRHANQLRFQLEQKQEIIHILEDHNINIFSDVTQWTQQMEKTYHSLMIINKDYQRRITELEEEISFAANNLAQTAERIKKMEEETEMCEKVRQKSKENYNQLALIKEQQIHRLQQKIKELEGEKNHAKEKNQQSLYQLSKQNKTLKERINKLYQYIQGKDQMTKKLSSFNNDLVLQNQILKQKQVEFSLHSPQSQTKEILELKSKYRLLEEVNRKLEIQLEVMKKRQSVKEIEIEQLGQELQIHKKTEKYSHQKDWERANGTIKEQKAIRKHVKNEVKNEKIKQKQRKIQNFTQTLLQQRQILDFYEKSEIRRKQAENIIIRGLKKRIEDIRQQILPLGTLAQKVQEKVYQFLEDLNQIPLMKEEYLLNKTAPQNTKLVQLFGEQLDTVKKCSKDKNRLKKSINICSLEQNSIRSYSSKDQEKKMKLEIEIDDHDQKVEYCYEKMKKNSNTQGYDSYPWQDFASSSRK